MGQKTVRFSDLSGQLIMREDALARIVIHEHPELGDGPVEIEVLADELRSGAKEVLRDLKALKIERIVLATGDRRDVAQAIAAGLPIDAVRSELSPDQKVMVVIAERKYSSGVS